MVLPNKPRYIFILLIIVLLFMVVNVRFIYIALSGGKEPKALVNNGLTNLRGDIYDLRGRVLATNELSYSIFANPKDFDEKELKEKLGKLARLLGIKEKRLIEKFNLNKSFNWLKRRIKGEEADEVRNLNMRGIYVREEYNRVYPQEGLLSHVLGFTNIDNEGIEGIEYSYEKELSAGDMGGDDVFRDFLKKGNNIYLTIDYDIQKVSELVLRRNILKYEAEEGSIIIMESGSGEIRAFSNYPRYNNNKYSKYEKGLFLNKGISSYYSPGSIMKVFTAGMLFEEGLLSEDKYFYCPGSIKVRGRLIRCHKEHGRISLGDVIRKSCNVGIVKASFLLDRLKFYKYLKKYGFGKKTGIDLPGEIVGRIPRLKDINKLSKSMLSIGYELGVTLIQLTSKAGVFANGGLLYRPKIVKRITNGRGEEVKLNESEDGGVRILSKKTSDRIYTLLRGVLEEGGTGHNAMIKDISLAGKTSTSNIYNREQKSFSKDKVNTSFIGFVPYNEKILTVLVFMRNPQKGAKSAAGVAAPVFKDLTSTLLDKGLIVSN